MLDARSAPVGIENSGFDGITLRAEERYEFSALMWVLDGAPPEITVELITDGETLAQSPVDVHTGGWCEVETGLVASAAASAQLRVSVARGRVAIDQVSLFPAVTFRAQRKGLRADLAETIAELQPRFVRFPGGCVAHGLGLGNIYRWKDTIGPLPARHQVDLRDLLHGQHVCPREGRPGLRSGQDGRRRAVCPAGTWWWKTCR